MSAKPYRICVFQIIRIRSGVKTLFRPRKSNDNGKVDASMQKRYKPREPSISGKVDGAEERPRAKTLYRPRFRPRESSSSDKVQPFTIDGDDGADKPSEMTALRTAHLKRGFSSQISDKTAATMQKVFQV